jgi:hypothetical protein
VPWPAHPAITPDCAAIDIDLKFLPQETKEQVSVDFEAFVHNRAQQYSWLREHPPGVQWDLYGLHLLPLNTPPDRPLVKNIVSARRRMGKETEVSGFIHIPQGLANSGLAVSRSVSVAVTSPLAALSKTKAMDAFAADIDPDECVAPFVVDGALADDIRCVEDQSWRHLCASPTAFRPPAPFLSNLSYEKLILTIVSATDCVQSRQSYHNGQDG